MKKSRILSSALVMTMVSFGAYAADEMITGGAGTCTVDVLGVSADGATANTIAVWSINEYTLAPGEYLNVTETSVNKTTCPAGSYCVGGADFTVENASDSIATCPTEYPNSATGAGAQNQCYTACTVATANIAHATAVGGNDYFGDGVDACYATDCDTGYHVDGGVTIVEQTPLIPVNYETAGNGYAYINPDGSTYDYDADIVPEGALTANGTWASVFDYGVVYGKASCQPLKDAGMEYIDSNLFALAGGEITVEEFRTAMLPLAGQAKTDFSVKVLQDVQSGKMSIEDMFKAIDVVFGSDYDAEYKTTDTGQYCYCQMDGFAPMNGDVLGEKTSVTSAPWVFVDGNVSADECAQDCASVCAERLLNDYEDTRAFRAAMFGAFGYTETATCTANTINIDWNPDNGGEHTKNMCTYDGSVTLPTPDPVKPGYTFTGWKLVEKTTTTE